MKKNLMDLRGFSENNIVLMIQDEPSYSQPDEYNMEDTLASLFEDANPFDTLFIHLIAPYASQGTNDDIPAGTLPLPIIHAYSILIVVPVVLGNQLVACSYFSLYFISNHLLYYSFFSFFFSFFLSHFGVSQVVVSTYYSMKKELNFVQTIILVDIESRPWKKIRDVMDDIVEI